MQLPPPTEIVAGERGRLELYVLDVGVVVQRASGHANREIAEAIVRGIDKALTRHRRVELWNDWHAARSYDPPVRAILTDYMVKRREEITETHILVGSRLVAMGLAVAGIVVRGIRSYDDPATFERELGARVGGGASSWDRGRKSGPPPPASARRRVG